MLDEQSKQRVKELCDRIAHEQDHKQFSMLIAELNQLLDPDHTDHKRNMDGRGNSNHKGDLSESSAETAKS